MISTESTGTMVTFSLPSVTPKITTGLNDSTGEIIGTVNSFSEDTIVSSMTPTPSVVDTTLLGSETFASIDPTINFGTETNTLMIMTSLPITTPSPIELSTFDINTDEFTIDSFSETQSLLPTETLVTTTTDDITSTVTPNVNHIPPSGSFVMKLNWTSVARDYNIAGRFVPWDELESYIKTMSKQFPDLITIGTAGLSSEGRPLYWVRLTAPRTTDELKNITIAGLSSTLTITGTTFNRTSRPSILISSGFHSREWIATALTMNLLDVWTAGYNRDPAITDLLNGFEIIFMPMTNPDGYVNSFIPEFRMWRKNMERTSVECFGVDLNRNFPTNEWSDPLNLGASSPDPCDETFRGHGAGASAETQGMMTFVNDYQNKTGNRLQLYMDAHSYSQLWMFPDGYDCAALYNEIQDLNDASAIATETVLGVHGLEYFYGDICNSIYAVSGSSADWMYQKGGIRYPFAIELRDTGTFGFLLPPEQIVPTIEEMHAGITASINFLASKI